MAERLYRAFTRRRPFVDSLRELCHAEPFRQRDYAEDECFINDVVIRLQQTKGSVFTLEYIPGAWHELLEDGHKSIRRAITVAPLTIMFFQQVQEADGAIRGGSLLRQFEGNWAVLLVTLCIHIPNATNKQVATEPFGLESFTD